MNAGNVKCVVWDLDNTLWYGTLAEGDRPELRSDVVNVIETLDRRGILNSIASKNDPSRALEVLESFGVANYFLYPQIGWGAKSVAVGAIAKSLNVSVGSFAFVDDEPFERDEVRSCHPSVLCIDAADARSIPKMPEMTPRFITEDSARRRAMYQGDARRNAIEASFDGPKESFLASLGMRLRIHRATEDDLRRAEELTIRTHQLNSTGYTYSFDELERFRRSDDHLLLIADLEDRYGPYGKIGLALVSIEASIWTIKLLLMSCRVMARGVGGTMITYIRTLAREMGARLLAEFIPTDVNRMMDMTYRFAHFREIDKRGPVVIFENDLSKIPSFPEYIALATS